MIAFREWLRGLDPRDKTEQRFIRAVRTSRQFPQQRPGRAQWPDVRAWLAGTEAGEEMESAAARLWFRHFDERRKITGLIG